MKNIAKNYDKYENKFDKYQKIVKHNTKKWK